MSRKKRAPKRIFYPDSKYGSLALAKLGAEFIFRLVPVGTHSWRKFIKPSELDIWARDAGLYLSNSTGLHYNPIFQEYSLGKGLDVNYILHFRQGYRTTHNPQTS